MVELNPNARIYIAGHGGLVGGALVRHFQRGRFHNFILRTRGDVDLTACESVIQLFQETAP